jgi:hypothetical protein
MGEKTKFPTLNPDGASVKGCNYIYAPRGQAGEYAPLAANPYRGCGHRCVYCYVPKVIKMSRGDFDAGATPRKNFLVKLRSDAAKYKALDIREQVMFSFTTDVYNPFNTSLTRPAIEILIEHGLAFCVLTKAGTQAWCDHELYRPDRDAFASTLTSLDERYSRKWQRSAAKRYRLVVYTRMKIELMEMPKARNFLTLNGVFAHNFAFLAFTIKVFATFTGVRKSQVMDFSSCCSICERLRGLYEDA